MEKIETLLKIETDNYATPKKLNRSDKQIPAHILESITSGQVTCEMLDALSGSVPVFKYKTCITLHGHFNLGPVMPRIGGYANIIRNQNGSLEVRYNAIDLDKKQRIAQVLRDCKADFRFSIDSQGTEFYSQTQVRDVAEYNAALTRYKAVVAEIEQIDFYGKTEMYKAQDMAGRIFIVCVLHANAIPETSVKAFMLTLTGLTEIEILTASENAQIKRDQEKAEHDAMCARFKEKQAATDQAVKELAAEIETLPKMSQVTGSIGIRVVDLRGKGPAYQIIQIGEKGSFGRYSYKSGFCRSLDRVGQFELKDAIKQAKLSELYLDRYRDATSLLTVPA